MNSIFKTTFLLSLLTILLVVMGGAVGGQGGMIVAFLIAAAMNFGSYWFSDKIVLRMAWRQVWPISGKWTTLLIKIVSMTR